MRLMNPLVWKKTELDHFDIWEAETPLGTLLIEIESNGEEYGFIAIWDDEVIANDRMLTKCKQLAEDWLLDAISEMIIIEVKDT